MEYKMAQDRLGMWQAAQAWMAFGGGYKRVLSLSQRKSFPDDRTDLKNGDLNAGCEEELCNTTKSNNA